MEAVEPVRARVGRAGDAFREFVSRCPSEEPGREPFLDPGRDPD